MRPPAPKKDELQGPITLTNLSGAKGSKKQPSRKDSSPSPDRSQINFSNLLEDVTYIPDPSSSQKKSQPEPVPTTPIEEAKKSLRLAEYQKTEEKPSNTSGSNSFEIVDVSSQEVKTASKKPSGSKENSGSSNLSDRIKSVVSEVPPENASASFSIS